MYKYKSAVYIGRFQPLHNGHLEVINHGLEISERLVVFIGCTGRALDRKDPFYAIQRYHMVMESIRPGDRGRLTIFPVYDRESDTAWAEFIKYCTHRVSAVDIDESLQNRTVLIGCKKDSSSYYLDLFTDWDCSFIECVNNISATDIREDFFNSEKLSNESVGKIPTKSNMYMNRLNKELIRWA